MGRKRERDDSSSSSSSDSSESDSDERKKKKRSKKRHKKEKKRKKEKRRKKEKKKRDESPPRATKGDEAGDRQPLTAPGYSSTAASRVEAPTPEPVVDSSKKKAMCPQRPEEYQAQQSVVREVYDPETGRMRLVRGTGEIIERIVSRDQQREINRRATQMDGLSFQASLRGVIQPPGR